MSSKEWIECKLEDIADIEMGQSPKSEFYNIHGEGMPFLQGNRTFGYLYPSFDTYTTDIKKLAYKGDVLISVRAPVGDLNIAPSNLCIGRGLSAIRMKNGNNRFLYYLLKANTSNIIKNETGSVFGSVNGKDLRSLKVYIPQHAKEQQDIVSILVSIDDKVELNKKINKILEEMAQAIFKSWFVDFTPFKEGEFVDSMFGLIPKDFKIVQLGDIADCVLGGTPSKSKKEYWDGNIPWINSGKVNDFRITKPSQTISKLGLEKSATKLLPKDTVVLAITGATLGQVSLLAIETCANQSVVGIIQNNIIRYSYIYPTILFRIIEIINMQTGGAQQHINKGNIESFPLLLPNKDIMNCYHHLVDPIYQMINQNCLMNDYLTEIRDSLLSKLITGEIRVPIEEVPNEEIR